MNFRPPCSFPRVGLAVLASILLLPLAAARAQQTAAEKAESFPGIKKALSQDQYDQTGLSKLSPEERQRLDDFLRGYFNGATQQVVQQAVAKATEKAKAQAVDEAVKQNKVEPPKLIQSRIIGPVSGWKSGQIFILENGQHWKIADSGSHYFRTVENPEVFIVRDFLSYKMAFAGGGVARVTRVK